NRGLDPGQGNAGRAWLDRQQTESVGVAKYRATGLGLPHVVDDRNSIVQHSMLEPLPGRRVEHLPCAENPLQRGQVRATGGVFAVAHQQADGGWRGEDAADAELLDDLPDQAGRRVVDRPLEGDRAAAGQQWRVDDVAVADYPADVGGRPPDVAR